MKLISTPGKFNPTALRRAKILWNFDHSECNRVKLHSQEIQFLTNNDSHNQHDVPVCASYVYPNVLKYWDT